MLAGGRLDRVLWESLSGDAGVQVNMAATGAYISDQHEIPVDDLSLVGPRVFDRQALDAKVAVLAHVLNYLPEGGGLARRALLYLPQVLAASHGLDSNGLTGKHRLST